MLSWRHERYGGEAAGIFQKTGERITRRPDLHAVRHRRAAGPADECAGWTRSLQEHRSRLLRHIRHTGQCDTVPRPSLRTLLSPVLGRTDQGQDGGRRIRKRTGLPCIHTQYDEDPIQVLWTGRHAEKPDQPGGDSITVRPLPAGVRRDPSWRIHSGWGCGCRNGIRIWADGPQGYGMADAQ